MNGINNEGIFSEAYPFEQEKQNDTKREENIWSQFLDLYSNIDKHKLLIVVRVIINEATMIMFRGSVDSGVNIKNRKKYAKVNDVVKDLEADFFSDDRLEKKSLKSFNRYIFRDNQVKTKLNELFPGDLSAQNEFLERTMFMVMDTRMKVFLFRHVNNQ